jgi:TIR domain/Restriction endonuclease
MTVSDDERVAESARVFLSYARPDRSAAEDIAQALKLADFQVWFDSWELRPGDSIATKIREGLSASDFLVVLLSPDSANSRWVREEVTLSLSNELRQRAISVVPAILRHCDVPQALRGFLPINLSDDRATGVAKLVERLRLAHDVNFSRLDPKRFEELVADVFRAEGFSVQASMTNRDGGHDLILTKTSSESKRNTDSPLYVVQVKHYKTRRVSVETIRLAIGSMVLAGQSAKGLIVSSSQLTSAAQEVVSDVNRKGLSLEVIDGPELERRVLQYPAMVAKYFRQADEI